MGTLPSARALMGASLGFHIVYAAIGVGMPLLLCVAEGIALLSGREVFRELARRWSKVVAVLLAIGAVSGTVLSFELGLLWPEFMRFAGGMIGMPFSLEGFAFFIEAIFVALYLYGWDVLSPRVHWLTSLPVVIASAASAVFVISVNAWMNTPAGFTLFNGRPADVSVLKALFNPAMPAEALHGTLACYVAVATAAAGVYAWALLRGYADRRAYNRAGLVLALGVAAVALPLQLVAGDLSARSVAAFEPAKLAAMEGLYNTRSGAPEVIGGLPDPGAHSIRYGIPIPKLLSFLAYDDPNATVRGLDSFPARTTADARLVHPVFDLMVGSGFLMLGALAVAGYSAWRRRGRGGIVASRPALLGVLVGAPFGFIALEAGWLTTEFGRQPWIVHGFLRTSEAVTPRTGVSLIFLLLMLVYLALTAGLLWLLLSPWRRARWLPPAWREVDGAAHG